MVLVKNREKNLYLSLISICHIAELHIRVFECSNFFCPLLLYTTSPKDIYLKLGTVKVMKRKVQSYEYDPSSHWVRSGSHMGFARNRNRQNDSERGARTHTTTKTEVFSLRWSYSMWGEEGGGGQRGTARAAKWHNEKEADQCRTQTSGAGQTFHGHTKVGDPQELHCSHHIRKVKRGESGRIKSHLKSEALV